VSTEKPPSRSRGARGRVTYALAGPDDDADLRALLRANPMDGDISVSMEREPSFFLGSTLEGDVHQTILARDRETGRPAGLASRSVLDGYVAAEPQPIGYLSQLRLAPEYRDPLVLSGGFRYLRELHGDGRASVYFTTIIEDNTVARRVLERDWKPKPHYEPLGVLSTLAIPLLWKRRPVPGVPVRAATPEDLPEIAQCLQRNYAPHPLAPVWTDANLTGARARGLNLSDFLVVERGSRISACLARWDQTPLKQNVIRGYAGTMRKVKPVVNALARVAPIPALPEPGEPLKSLFLSHVAVDGNDVETARALVTRAYNDTRGGAHAFATIGFAETHPLCTPLKRAFTQIEYRAVIYAAYWPDGADVAAKLKGGAPHLEAALL